MRCNERKKRQFLRLGEKHISFHISLFCDETRLRRERGGEVFRVVIIQTLLMSGVSNDERRKDEWGREMCGM